MEQTRGKPLRYCWKSGTETEHVQYGEPGGGGGQVFELSGSIFSILT